MQTYRATGTFPFIAIIPREPMLATISETLNVLSTDIFFDSTTKTMQQHHLQKATANIICMAQYLRNTKHHCKANKT